MKKAWVSVINDLSTDQRVDRTCRVLTSMGYRVTLVGRKLPGSPGIGARPYATKRMRMLFTKGPLFYMFFNMRLFFLLLFSKTDLLVSNDLDTLLACRLVSRIKGIPLVYDTHEIFCEVPELAGRWAKKTWLFIEKSIFPKLKYIITVNDSIAEWYFQKYGTRPRVIRNIPDTTPVQTASRSALGLPEDRFIVILQGSGINVDRGAEELLASMKYLEGALLVILGGGDVITYLKEYSQREGLSTKVLFLPRKPYPEMMQYTRNADLGATLDKDTNLNYRFSLPNKLFDYLHAGIPVLASPLPEVEKIVRKYEAGLIIPSHDPAEIAKCIQELMRDRERLEMYRRNALKAAAELSWPEESEKLKKIFASIG